LDGRCADAKFISSAARIATLALLGLGGRQRQTESAAVEQNELLLSLRPVRDEETVHGPVVVLAGGETVCWVIAVAFGERFMR